MSDFTDLHETELAYQIRRLQPHDADGVLALVRRVYGSTYIHAELYHPEQLLKRNDSGQLISAVAVNAENHVVGHYALIRPDLGPVAETGEGMVLPECRGHHVFQRLRGFLEDEARRLGLFGLTGRPVASHVFSQKVYEEFHCHPTGLELAFSRMVNDFQALAGPVSVLMYFKFLGSPTPAVHHLPQRHRALVSRIAQRMGREATFSPGQPVGGSGRLVSEIHPGGAGCIRVTQIGVDTPEAIEQARIDLCRQGAIAVVLRLPLANPGTEDLCLASERQGFFFSGIDPRPADEGDVLQLQYVAVPIDGAALQVHDPFAREIVDYVLTQQRGATR